MKWDALMIRSVINIMHQVRLFAAGDTTSLEKMINGWLQQNADSIQVIDIRLETTHAPKANPVSGLYHTAMIVYTVV